MRKYVAILILLGGICLAANAQKQHKQPLPSLVSFINQSPLQQVRSDPVPARKHQCQQQPQPGPVSFTNQPPQQQPLSDPVPFGNQSLLLEPESSSQNTSAQSEPLEFFPTRCIDDLGCFYTGPPFYHPTYRPVSLLPTDKYSTRFLLYNPLLQDKPEVLLNLTEESVSSSSFLSELPTKILIHGYFTKLEEGDVQLKIKTELLKEGFYNVIVVNWTEQNGDPYPQAVANGRVVGAQVAKLINLLMLTKGVRPQSFHIIGHSLGAHVSGWAGERINSLERITGLDPAGPYFQHAEDVVRLDITDATFVDVIHTDAGDNTIEGYGIRQRLGHLDYYPNGGSQQPGCRGRLRNVTPLGVDKSLANSCQHGRARYLFLDSILRCRFVAKQCENYASFKSGDCDQNASVTSLMGLPATKIENSDPSRGFYLDTNGREPFCKN